MPSDAPDIGDFDLNGDGKLSGKELKAYKAAMKRWKQTSNTETRQGGRTDRVEATGTRAGDEWDDEVSQLIQGGFQVVDDAMNGSGGSGGAGPRRPGKGSGSGALDGVVRFVQDNPLPVLGVVALAVWGATRA